MAASILVTTADRVYSALGHDPDDESDVPELDGLIAEVSTAFEAYMGRPFLEAARVEVRDTEAHQYQYWLRAFPILSIASIVIRQGVWTSFADGTTLNSTDYDFEAATGRVVLGVKSTWDGALTMQVTYTAGFALTTAAFVTAYPDIASAADRQIAHEWFRRKALDMSSVSVGGGGSLSTMKPVGLVPAVTKTLDAYRSPGAW